ncbi:MAG: DUF2809 domain-containing protein [Phycisphaerae bacterium]|nr:DUF2809 domain-containing protein [Phycisphaerae bacterium]
MENNIKRNRLLYIALTLVTIACGLLSRSEFVPMPDFVSTYGGDTLWAMMVFWLFCIFAPGWKTWQILLAALLFSFAIEYSQLYHAPWIDSLRHTTPGGLVLGFGFKSSDLVCYTIGILLGAGVRFAVNYRVFFRYQE